MRIILLLLRRLLALDAAPRGAAARCSSRKRIDFISSRISSRVCAASSCVSAVRSTLRSTVASVRLSCVDASSAATSSCRWWSSRSARRSLTRPSTPPTVSLAVSSVRFAVASVTFRFLIAPRRSPESSRFCALASVSLELLDDLVDRQVGDLVERRLDLVVQHLHSGGRGRHLGVGGVDTREAGRPVGHEVEVDRLLPGDRARGLELRAQALGDLLPHDLGVAQGWRPSSPRSAS